MKLKIGEGLIKVKDMDESRKFYEDVLGFEFVEQEGDCFRIKLNDHKLLLMPVEADQAPRVGFDFMTDSVAGIKDRLHTAGFKTEDQEYGDWKCFTVNDPNGIEFQIIEEK